MIHHIAITTDDVLKLSEFYCGLPGLFHIQDNREGNSLRSVWIGMKGSESILMVESGEKKAPFALVFDLFSPLADEEKSPEAIQAVYREIIPAIDRKTNYTFYFPDPDGNTVGYSSYPEKIADYITYA